MVQLKNVSEETKQPLSNFQISNQTTRHDYTLKLNMKPLHDASSICSACLQGDMISVTDIYINILHTHLLTIKKKKKNRKTQSYLF